MPYALRFDGVNDVVSIPNGMTGNVGTSAYSFRVKSGPTGVTLPSANAGIIGTTQASNSNGLILTPTGQLRVFSAGQNRYGSNAQLIFTGVEFDYTVTHLANGNWDIFNNLTNTPTGESGVFTNSTSWAGGTNALNQFGRPSSTSTVFLQGDIALIAVTGLTNSQTWDADLSGGAGATLPTISGTNQGTLTNFDIPACWVFYSTGSSFTGTIGKTSLSILTKSLSTQLGLVIESGKSSNTLSNKSFSVSVGTVLGVGKQTLVLSNKQESTRLGYVNTLSKLGYTLATKQLTVVVGANLPFIGVLNKTTYSLLGKQLSTSLGWSGGVTKQSLSVVGKQESANIGYSSLLQKLIITLNSKPLSVQVGTAIPFIGLLNKLQLNAVGKSLSVSVGTSIPFLGLIDKTSLLLSGKALAATRGQYIEIVPSHIPLITKLLSIGEVVYPVIPKRRVYGLNDKIRLYIMRR